MYIFLGHVLYPLYSCDVRYEFRITNIFDSSLSPVVCRRAHVIFPLSVFVCLQWCPTHLVVCLCCVFLRLVVSLSGLATLHCPFGVL